MKTFHVSGRVTDVSGEPWPGALVAVMDRDLLSDDLISIVRTGSDGRFATSFTAAAFNQDAFERETTPDLYLVVSTAIDGQLRAVHRVDFPGRVLGSRDELGEVRAPCLRELPLALEGQEPLPGYGKRVRRLRIDHDTLAEATAEMSPVVASLTGIDALREGIQVRVDDGLGAIQVESSARLTRATEWAPGSLEARADAVMASLLGRWFRFKGFVALYDPHSRTIVIDRAKAEPMGLDGLKMVVGHELVHACQFLAHPGLGARFDELNRDMFRAVGLMPDEPARPDQEPAARRAMLRFSANLEGHASHLEVDHLRPLYGSTVTLSHASLAETSLLRADALVASLRSRLSGEPATDGPLHQTRLDAARPYALGLEAYRALGDRSLVFDPSLEIDTEEA